VETLAILLSAPEQLSLSRLKLTPPGAQDVVVDIDWSGISTGTERLLWSGRMPSFPGMGYPLVPGYESVGEVIEAGADSPIAKGSVVFVPGANCYGSVRGLFGGASSELVTASDRVVEIGPDLQEKGVLFALAATAYHAVEMAGANLPDLIVGHGVMGRLMARIVVARGGSPTVWDTQAERLEGAQGYILRDPASSKGQMFESIVDASGAGSAMNQWIAHLRPGGRLVLAGFYSQPLSFDFAPAFMRELSLQVAAQWQPNDLRAVTAMVREGVLSLDGLITNQLGADHAAEAYQCAFEDPSALKVVMDWRGIQ
jgi:3-hydroxyethyl bacteriochlorophyllide a dehydrogenase